MTVAYLTDHPRFTGTLEHLDVIRLRIIQAILSHGSDEQRQVLRDFIDDQPLLIQEVGHG